MISEGSCDTEDWSNDAENSVLFRIFRNVTVLLAFTVFFAQINASLGEHKRHCLKDNYSILLFLFQMIKKSINGSLD